MSDKPQGKLIAFCGIDGAGKSTNINLASEILSGLGLEHIKIKQPTTWFREQPLLRACIDEGKKDIDQRSLALLSAVDRLVQQENEIIPALDAGKIILSDRYLFSSYAYLYGRGFLDEEWIKEINKHIILPDITFYIDIDPEVAVRRVVARDGSSRKKEEQDMLTMSRVRERFIQLGDKFDFTEIDGSLDVSDQQQIILNKILSVL